MLSQSAIQLAQAQPNNKIKYYIQQLPKGIDLAIKTSEKICRLKKKTYTPVQQEENKPSTK